MNNTLKVVRIIEYLALAEKPIGLSEISKGLAITKPNLFKILSILCFEGWVHHSNKKYCLTGYILGISSKIASNLNLLNISTQYMSRLNLLSGETVALSIRINFQRMYLLQIVNPEGISSNVPVGKRLQLWTGGADAMAILSFMTNKEIETVFNQIKESGFSILSSGQSFTIKNIKERLEKIRYDKYAISNSEVTIGACSVAAPIFGHEDEVIGALYLGGPVFRFSDQRAEGLSSTVVKFAEEISILNRHNFKDLRAIV